MKQNSLILFSVGLLLLCAALSNDARPVRQTDAVVENRKVESTQAQEETATGPVYSGNLKLGRVITNVDYCGGEGRQMDIYFPLSPAKAPWPALIYVHGGGWRNGDKSTGGAGVIQEVIARGFLVAAVNYRLFSKDPQGGLHNTFPVMIEDVKCAVRYLRAHATQYSLDPKRFGAWGWSAGGHLVSLLGTSNDGDFATPQLASYSARIQAVVDMYGPENLEAPGYCHREFCKEIFNNDQDVIHRAGPINYVSHDDPPFLIIQGDQDTLVPPGQSQELLEKLQAASVSARLVMVANAEHMLKPTPPGAQINPSNQQINKMVADFFDQHLNR
jgi:acetyl esterase/lipase